MISNQHQNVAAIGQKRTLDMPRSLSPKREQEYQELLGFVSFYINAVMRKKHDTKTVEGECERIAREFGRSAALEGLKQATNDFIEDAGDYSPESVTLIDEALRNAGLITLSEVRRRYAASYKRILRRGTINTETEYYLVNGIVVDLATSIADDERIQLQMMIKDFEEQLLPIAHGSMCALAKAKPR